jgi:hypothetical protein
MEDVTECSKIIPKNELKRIIEQLFVQGNDLEIYESFVEKRCKE